MEPMLRKALAVRCTGQPSNGDPRTRSSVAEPLIFGPSPSVIGDESIGVRVINNGSVGKSSSYLRYGKGWILGV
jgi:hypothetical protein